METAAAVIRALERAPEIVVPLVREVPPVLLKRRPTARKWSAHEHACHLAFVHGLFFDRLDQILASPTPVIAPYEPGQSDPDDLLLNMDLDESLEKYAYERRQLVERLRELSPMAWSRTADHAEYSHYSVSSCFATSRCTISSMRIVSRNCY